MKIKTTYDQYMNLIADSSPGRIEDEAKVIIERFRHPQHLLGNYAATTFLIDYTTKKYLYLDGSCIDLMGNPAAHYYERGLDETLRQTYSSDYRVVNENVFPVNFNFLKTLPLEKYPDIVFSHNFRIQKPDACCSILLQRYSYIAGTETGHPVGVIGVAFNITHFKTDVSIIHTIEETIRDGNELINKLLYKATYPVFDIGAGGSLSSRELEVLKFMGAGLTSKEIANLLNISTNTVNNHRKNMLAKTGCKSAAELLSHSVKHGLI